MKIHNVDCKNAFLNGPIDKELYIEQPSYFVKENTTQKSHVCCLSKALYSLKQAPLIWNQMLTKALVAGRFTRAEYDPCIFVKRTMKSKVRYAEILAESLDEVKSDREFCILGIYVDDIVIMAKHEETIAKAKKLITTNFVNRDLGPVTKIVGIEVSAVAGGILLHQNGFINEILTKKSLESAHGHATPMEPNAVTTLTSKDASDKPANQSQYRSLIGELLYASVCTRPDITFAVNLLARATESPCEKHVNHCRRVLKYLASHRDHGILFKKTDSDNIRLTAFCDSDFACDKKDSRSTTGYVIMLNGCAIHWRTTKQKSNTTSTVEAEYLAACTAVKELVWTQFLVQEILGLAKSPVPNLLMDNQGAESLSRNAELSTKTKHIRYTFHYLRNCVASKLVNLSHVGGDDNPADMFTKPLAAEKFERHCNAIKLASRTIGKCGPESKGLRKAMYLATHTLMPTQGGMLGNNTQGDFHIGESDMNVCQRTQKKKRMSQVSNH